MLSYFIRRMILIIPVLIGVMIVTFLLMFIVPGDPITTMMGQRADDEVIARIRKQLNLDAPWYIQFFYYMKRTLQGDLGTSYVTHIPVREELAKKFPNTIRLTLGAMFISIIMGLTIGVVSAVYQNTWIDTGSMVFALTFISTPVFWFGLVLIYFFGIYLRWLPISGMGDGSLKYLILPAVTLGTRSAAYLARMTRSIMLEQIRQDYVQTARSKGLKERVVILKHAFKNALIPIVTIIGMSFASYLNGSVLTESIFGWPGFGRYVVDAIYKRDFEVIAGCVLFGAVIFVFANLIVDLTYGYLDPRIRYE